MIEKFQWITAGTVFANPFPALELVANGAVQFQMISELAGVYGVQISTSHVRMIGGQMIQMLLKLGLVETATSLVAGIFKSTLVGYAAAGGVQAVSMAYLTHVSGEAFAEYFRARPDLGRRRHAGRLDPPVRPHQPRRVPSGIRQAGRAEGLDPIVARSPQNARTARGQEVNRSDRTNTMSKSPGSYPRLFPTPDQTIAGIGRALREGRTSCVEILERLPRAG